MNCFKRLIGLGRFPSFILGVYHLDLSPENEKTEHEKHLVWERGGNCCAWMMSQGDQAMTEERKKEIGDLEKVGKISNLRVAQRLSCSLL